MSLDEIVEIYRQNEVSVHDVEDGFVVIIKDDCEISEFLPIAIRFWDSFCEYESRYTLMIKNGVGQSSEIIQMNIDTEIE